MSNEYALEACNIIKRYPGVTALDDVTIRICRGEIHALVGENGAGKSTLMKILSGAITKDSGNIVISGKEALIRNPIDSLEYNIGMIYQELTYIPDMSVAENIFIGHELTNPLGFVDSSRQNKEVRNLLKMFGMDINPNTRMNELSAAKKQMIEIAKAIYFKKNIIIMDEPTSSLTEQEIKQLFTVLKKLRGEGITIIYISHKLDEIFEICDRISVLRDGKLVGNWLTSEMTAQSLITAMVGREISQLYPAKEKRQGEKVLEVKGFTKKGEFSDISFFLRKGEILGISGLVGSGRTEVANAIFGYTHTDEGEIYKNGKRIKIKDPADAIKNGLGYVTEDRKVTGLNLLATIEDNICVTILDSLNKGPFLDFRKGQEISGQMVSKLRIKISNLRDLVSGLSGGNQQKVVLAKWIAGNTDILILDEPTRGIDVGAKAEIHRLIVEMTKQGLSVIVISSELPEIIGLCHRIIVMHEGRKISEIQDESEMNQEKIMAYATAANKRNYSEREEL